MLLFCIGFKLQINEDLVGDMSKPTWRVEKSFGNKSVTIFLAAKSSSRLGITEILVQLSNYFLPSKDLFNIVKTFVFGLNLQVMKKKETRIAWGKCSTMITYRRNFNISSGDTICLEFPVKRFLHDPWNELCNYMETCNIDSFRFMRKEDVVQQPPPFVIQVLTMENQYLSKICSCSEQFCSSSMFFLTTNVCDLSVNHN